MSGDSGDNGDKPTAARGYACHHCHHCIFAGGHAESPVLPHLVAGLYPETFAQTPLQMLLLARHRCGLPLRRGHPLWGNRRENQLGD